MGYIQQYCTSPHKQAWHLRWIIKWTIISKNGCGKNRVLTSSSFSFSNLFLSKTLLKNSLEKAHKQRITFLRPSGKIPLKVIGKKLLH